MTEPVDWAPYASDGKEFRILAPLGISYCLATDDIPGAKPTPATKQYLRGQVGNKMFPEVWLPSKPSVKYKNLQTERIVDPLEPEYKLASGNCLIPAGDPAPFSKRVTDLLDTSDIPGTKPGSMCKQPLRTCVCSCIPDYPGFSPSKKTLLRKRTAFGHGLDLFDIDLGRRKFGFSRTIISSPLEPKYPNEVMEDPSTEKHSWVKKRVFAPRIDNQNALEKILDKVYAKVKILPFVCRAFDPNDTKQINHSDFLESLKQFGVRLSGSELNEVISFADKDHVGTIRYNQFAQVLRNLDSFERISPRRLGAELGVPPSDTNLGQGCQVLVEPGKKIKRTIHRGSQQNLLYNIISGEPISGFFHEVPNRVPFYVSYSEQAAALGKCQQQERSKLLISLPRHLKLPPMKDTSQTVSPSIIQSAPDEDLPQSDTVEEENHGSASVMQHLPPVNSLQIRSINKLQEGNVAINYQLAPRNEGTNLKQQFLCHSRIPRPKRLLPHPFKQRIQEEQHSADLHEVQFLN